MWRKLRISILLIILITVAHNAWLQAKDVEWKKSLYVAVYPVNADGSPKSERYIKTLNQEQLAPIEEYLADQAKQYGLAAQPPFKLRLGVKVDNRPPQPAKGGNVLQTIVWSLQFRWWAWRNSPHIRVPPQIRMYLLFHDPERYSMLPHSTALHKGRIGLVNVYADHDHEKQNAVVLAHELLHTVGATDKYDLANSQPMFPEGYAHPEKHPRYPQSDAELMAGRISISPTQSRMPESLAQTMVGNLTAQEIGWRVMH